MPATKTRNATPDYASKPFTTEDGSGGNETAVVNFLRQEFDDDFTLGKFRHRQREGWQPDGRKLVPFYSEGRTCYRFDQTKALRQAELDWRERQRKLPRVRIRSCAKRRPERATGKNLTAVVPRRFPAEHLGRPDERLNLAAMVQEFGENEQTIRQRLKAAGVAMPRLRFRGMRMRQPFAWKSEAAPVLAEPPPPGVFTDAEGREWRTKSDFIKAARIAGAELQKCDEGRGPESRFLEVGGKQFALDFTWMDGPRRKNRILGCPEPQCQRALQALAAEREAQAAPERIIDGEPCIKTAAGAALVGATATTLRTSGKRWGIRSTKIGRYIWWNLTDIRARKAAVEAAESNAPSGWPNQTTLSAVLAEKFSLPSGLASGLLPLGRELSEIETFAPAVRQAILYNPSQAERFVRQTLAAGCDHLQSAGPQPQVLRNLFSTAFPAELPGIAFGGFCRLLAEGRENGSLSFEGHPSLSNGDTGSFESGLRYCPDDVAAYIRERCGLPASPKNSGLGESKRPCFERDHQFLAWYEAEGEETFHSHAAIRDRWNAENPRDRIDAADNGRDIVKKAIRLAKKERKNSMV